MIPPLKVLLRAIRIHQWVKNLLLFVPVIMAHRFTDTVAVWSASLGFLSFSLCASAVYLVNDMLDVEADRAHMTKKRRPIASGELSIRVAKGLIPLFVVGAAICAYLLPEEFWCAIAIYFIVTFLYSLRLKRVVLVDIMVLASLYTIRILAGGSATEIVVSPWLLVFSLFFFLSLACVKRYSELVAVKKRNEEGSLGRAYRVTDLAIISESGVSCGCLSVLVLALYVNSKEVAPLYSHPELLWLLCPLVLFWIQRVWLLAHRERLHDDPIVFAISDPVSYFVGLIALGVMGAAM